MQRLGLVLHLSPNHNIIAKVEKIPRIGETVVDEKLRPVGKVFDILGPVSAPYTVVRPTVSNPEKFITKTLYVVPSKRRREKK